MTEREQVEYEQTRAEVLQRAGGCCEVCGMGLIPSIVQVAHRIPQRKHLIKKYGKKIIHHPCNLVATCSEKCNADVSLGENIEQHKYVLHQIQNYKREEMWYE